MVATLRAYLLGFIAFLGASGSASAQTHATRIDVLSRLAESEHRLNFAATAARLRLNIDTERAYRDIDTLLAREYGDMFWMYGMTGLYYSCRDILPDAVRTRFREAWKNRTPYRGDTENHFLMYYASLFLMVQEWPNLHGSEWFTGQSSHEIYDEASDYLQNFVRDVSENGQIEFDSPRYQYYFITPLVLLAEYTQDSELRRKFRMALELVLADYAQDYFYGSYAGAHSRTSDGAALKSWQSEVTSHGQFYFEDSVRSLSPDVGFAALAEFTCPQIIRTIATDRSTSYQSIETKRPRPAIRYFRPDSVVTRYTYVTPTYALGSISDGLIQPIQQQSWKLITRSSDKENTITGLNPHFSEYELGAFFPEEPSFMAERIGGAKAGYPSENKWVGGSPYEKITQDRNVLIAEYKIPGDARFKHVDLFLPQGTRLLDTTAHSGTWNIYEFDSVVFALRTLGRYEHMPEASGTRLRFNGRHTWYILVVQNPSHSLTDFRRMIKSADVRENKRDGGIRITMDGRTISTATSNRSREVWLYQSPFIRSKRGSGVVELTAAGEKRVLDFRENTIR